MSTVSASCGFNAPDEEAVALILACLRAHYDSSDPARPINRVNDGTPWPKVLSTARKHGIVPLVYESLSRNLSGLPEKARNELRYQFSQNAAHSFSYATELVRLLKYLEEQGISALAFKGPALAILLYGKLSLRTVRDLDLLVADGQVNSALQALQACGYEPVSGSEGAAPSVSTNTRKHIWLIHQERGFSVELHWAITEPSFVFPLRFKQVWAERQMVVVMDRPVATPSREHTLLMMCAHGTNHCWGSLKWICDIGQAVTAFSDLDWDSLLARAQTLGCRRMLVVSLALASEICAVRLPPELKAHVRSEKIIQICRDVQTQLFSERKPMVHLERTLTFVRSRERLTDRMRILLRFIAPKLKPNARDRSLMRVPNRLKYLYIPLRLIRLTVLYWKSAILPILQGAIDRAAPIPPK